jgi:hypothetical protein
MMMFQGDTHNMALLVLWSCGPVVLWSCGPVVLWYCACCLQEQLPVGPFRTFQVALSVVEDLTGLMWDDVVKGSEVYGQAAAAALGEAASAAAPVRHELRSFADIVM